MRNVLLSLDLMREMPAAEQRDDEGDGGRRKRLLHALRQAEGTELTLRQKECLMMYYGEQVTEREIARRLGVSTPTVCRHLEKARNRLNRALRYLF